VYLWAGRSRGRALQYKGAFQQPSPPWVYGSSVYYCKSLCACRLLLDRLFKLSCNDDCFTLETNTWAVTVSLCIHRTPLGTAKGHRSKQESSNFHAAHAHITHTHLNRNRRRHSPLDSPRHPPAKTAQNFFFKCNLMRLPLYEMDRSFQPTPSLLWQWKKKF